MIKYQINEAKKVSFSFLFYQENLKESMFEKLPFIHFRCNCGYENKNFSQGENL